RGSPAARKDSWPDQQFAAAEVLGAIAPGTPQADQAVAALIESLSFETPQSEALTVAVIEALARFGPLAQGAIPRLRELEHGPNTSVSGSARQALATLEGAK